MKTYRTRVGATAVLVSLVSLAPLASLGSAAHAGPSVPWVQAWGHNGAGQLGNGSTLDQQTPTSVRGLARGHVRELAGGGYNSTIAFAVALLRDGTVQTWGGNSDGQLGDGTRASRPHPAAVAGLSGVTEVAAGGYFAYAVRSGRVLAWGDNASGQLGNGTTTASPTPVMALPPGSGTTRVAASTSWTSSYAY
ncbi:hypothetical protein AB0G79_26075 [Streptomyces sp. NPDC020807]|uniref:RCC1 domain-containing protein n=1 Tax=Streptomyces sp. NPDC020807 TaxID=3155119 RepID=UPI003400BD99